MSNQPTPDRAQPNELDGLEDVPTYKADESSDTGSMGKFYQRFGRTAPKNIEPDATDKPTTTTSEAEMKNEPEATSNLYRVSSEPEPTAEFSAPTNNYQPQTMAAPLPDDTYAAPAVGTYSEDETVIDNRHGDGRRGTIDLGLMIIRVVVGAVLLLSALRTFFQLGGAPGLNELKSEYGTYAMPELLSLMVPTMELIAGVFLLVGLLTPVAAAVATAVTGFNAVHAIAQSEALNLLNPAPELLLPILLAVLALGLQFTGPGKVSLDVSRSWARRPLASSWIWVIIGIAGAVLMWWFLAGTNPLG
ncbi:DoxX family protein [Corynebacterium sp. H127]|uniref:DoxX family protein n=1 Tax=Corynebacterium sp. H127 TaxID=3133418 RepID=UPI0030B2C9D1